MVHSPLGSLARTSLGAASALLLAALATACHPAPVALAPTVGGEMDEVSIGYGTTGRRDMTGSVSSADTEQMGGHTQSRVEEMMIGRFPGVEVTNLGGTYQIRIRGNRSIIGDNNPLVVIDGVVLSDGILGLSMLSPSDVQRIDVLKDAASTAVYGSRGSNGVILITMRRSD